MCWVQESEVAGSPCVEWATKGLQSHLTPARKTDKYFLNIHIHLNTESHVQIITFLYPKFPWLKRQRNFRPMTSRKLLCIYFALPVGNIFLQCVSDPDHVEIFQRKPFWWDQKIWTDQFLAGLIKKPLGCWSRSETWRNTHVNTQSLNWRWQWGTPFTKVIFAQDPVIFLPHVVEDTGSSWGQLSATTEQEEEERPKSTDMDKNKRKISGKQITE